MAPSSTDAERQVSIVRSASGVMSTRHVPVGDGEGARSERIPRVRSSSWKKVPSDLPETRRTSSVACPRRLAHTLDVRQNLNLTCCFDERHHALGQPVTGEEVFGHLGLNVHERIAQSKHVIRF